MAGLAAGGTLGGWAAPGAGSAGVFLGSSDSGASTGLTAGGGGGAIPRSSPKRGIPARLGPERVMELIFRSRAWAMGWRGRGPELDGGRG